MKELIFEVTQEADGGFVAEAIGEGIFTQADSWDGTHLGFMPSEVNKINAAVLQARAMKKQERMFE